MLVSASHRHDIKNSALNEAGQTYEGGLSSVPGSEAHGSYTFCALACLCIIGLPGDVMPK